jgi:phenylpropionate dioxygenase-like ring-hydroxylating dioxygenase large terminal subunit
MERETQRIIIDKILDFYKRKESDVAAHSSTIPVSHYTSEERYRAECETLFRGKMPIIVGRSTDIPNAGDYLTFSETGVPLLIARGKEGKLKAYINVCRHRGTQIVSEEKGSNKRSFTCPYHSWTYNLEGKLIGVPHEYGFNDCDKKELGLTELSVEEQFGFIRCIPAPAADPPFSIPESIVNDFKSYQPDTDITYDVRIVERNINWKLTIDTFLENYHVNHAHRQTIDQYFLDNICVCEQFGQHVRIVFPKKSILELEGMNSKDYPDIRKHANILYFIFPNTLILIEPDHISMSYVYPQSIDKTKVVSYTLLQKYPETEKAKAYWAKNNDILYTALEEDFDMAKLVQQGLHSKANEFLIHGRFEKGLRFFHQAIEEAL